MSEFSNLIASSSYNDAHDINSPTEKDGAKEFKPKPGSRRSRSSANTSRRSCGKC